MILGGAALALPLPRHSDPLWVFDRWGDSARGKTAPEDPRAGAAADVDLVLARITPVRGGGWHLWLHFRRLTNPLGNRAGYSHPQVDLLEAGDGTSWQPAYPGANVRIAGGVRQQVRVSPGGAYWIPGPGKAPVPLAQEVFAGAIRVHLPRDFVPPKTGVILVGSYNPLHPDGYREVREHAGPDVWGGGMDDYLDPHVLDVAGAMPLPRRQPEGSLVEIRPIRLTPPPLLWREAVLAAAGLCLLTGAALIRSGAHRPGRAQQTRKPREVQPGTAAPASAVFYGAGKVAASGPHPPGALRQTRGRLRRLPDLRRR